MLRDQALDFDRFVIVSPARIRRPDLIARPPLLSVRGDSLFPKR
jgi:hypothetical protein